MSDVISSQRGLEIRGGSMQFMPMPERRDDGKLPSSCAPHAYSLRIISCLMNRLHLLVFTLIALISGMPMAGAEQLEDLLRQAGIRVVSKGESSTELEKRTAAMLPMSQISEENRRRVSEIVSDCNQFRRLPTLQYTVDEPMYRYLLEHPDVAVSTWRVMGISRFEMWQTGPMEYEARAIDGSEGLADILYRDKNQMLFICEGMYHNPVLPKPLQASALIWFRATFTPNAEGTHVVSQRADVFVRFPSNGVSAVAKVLSPITNPLMDRNLFEISLYSSMMSRAVRDEPEWVVQVAQQLDGVLPQRKDELLAVARLPRRNDGKAKAANGPASDRKIVLSPQLFFFDPPKTMPAPEQPASDAKVRTAALTTTKSPASVTIPAQTASFSPPVRMRDQVPANQSDEDQPAAQSDDEFALQPALPPAGSTATDSAGSNPTPPSSGRLEKAP
ncbi:MAG: hypothetical protein ACK58L_17820 [Planctomycetota bacterium]